MSGSHFILVADDLRMASAIQSHLEKTFGQAAQAYSYQDVRPHLGPDTHGLLVLALASPSDLQQALHLIQEVCLRQWPVSIIIVELPGVSEHKDLTYLDTYVAARLPWPAEAATLSHLARARLGRWPNVIRPQAESAADVIERRLLCHTPSLLPMVERMTLAASHDVTVLFTGETGTGKTHLAQLMHQCSPRKDQRFLAVPCGALSANLIESEFFGHVRGAFTGADRPKQGKFAVVGQGTLLLDEIDALGLEQQANLLRVIETGEYEPVGSNETLRCNARIMVASNWNLEEAVERSKFRQDLYYRLNVMAFHLPPLRERLEDVAPLVRSMATRFCHKFHKELYEIHPDALAALESFPWPGNIRQLENVVQQAVLVSTGTQMLPSHLPQPVQEYAALRQGTRLNGNDSLAHSRENLERNVIQRTLMSCNYSRARAAHALGISRVTLYKKMKKYDLMAVPLSPKQAE